MEWFLVVVLVVGLPLALAVWLIARAVGARSRIEELSSRLSKLELEIWRLKESQEAARATEAVPTPASSPEPSAISQALEKKREATPTPAPTRLPTPQPRPEGIAVAAPQAPVVSQPVAATAPTLPPPPVMPVAPKRPSTPASKATLAIDWEQFMGVKLFAWLGGFALFLGVVFFVKYAFEHNLVPPELRVAMGFLVGVGLVGGGTVLHGNPRYTVTAQTLCATGVVILYATTFACRSIYHFEFFDLIPTFLLMILITTTAFLLAVRLPALVVAILGMLGGFFTPVLLSTGEDNPFGLFGYIAILDAGLIIVALHRRWHFLTALAAIGTVLMQIGWAAEFFTREKYFEANNVLIPMGVLFVFNALYVAAMAWAKRRAQSNWWLAGGALGLAAAALAFAGYFLSFAPLAQRPWLVLGFVFLIDFAILGLVLLDGKLVGSPGTELEFAL